MKIFKIYFDRLKFDWIIRDYPTTPLGGGQPPRPAPRRGRLRATDWAPLQGRARPKQVVCTAGWRSNTQIWRGRSHPRPRASVGGELSDGGGAWVPDGATGGHALMRLDREGSYSINHKKTCVLLHSSLLWQLGCYSELLGYGCGIQAKTEKNRII